MAFPELRGHLSQSVPTMSCKQHRRNAMLPLQACANSSDSYRLVTHWLTVAECISAGSPVPQGVSSRFDIICAKAVQSVKKAWVSLPGAGQGLRQCWVVAVDDLKALKALKAPGVLNGETRQVSTLRLRCKTSLLHDCEGAVTWFRTL